MENTGEERRPLFSGERERDLVGSADVMQIPFHYFDGFSTYLLIAYICRSVLCKMNLTDS